MAEDLKPNEKARKYEAIFDSLVDGVIIISREFQTLWANKTVVGLYGNTEKMYKGKCYNFFYGHNEPCSDCPCVKVFADEKPHRRLQYVIDQNNRAVWRDVRANPYYDQDHYLIGSIEVISDHTKLKETEEALRRSEGKYASILESIEEGYYEVDLDGNFTFVNDSLCRLKGSIKDELIGTNARDYTDLENANRLFQMARRVYTTGEPARLFDWVIERRDGTTRNVECSASLIKNSEGRGTGFKGILRDVTEKRETEAELLRTKNFLENIFDSSIDGVTTTDLHGTVIYTSPRAKDILGYEQNEIIRKKVHLLYSNGIEDAKIIMRELTAKGELRHHDLTMIRKDGTLVDITLSASFLRSEKGEVIGTLGMYRDITEKKKLEAQLERARRLEGLGTLAGGVAHNFNNLLMGIQGNVSLILLETDATHPHYKRLKSIEGLVKNGAKLTGQLLGYARGGAYEFKPISLNQLVEETSDIFSMTKKEVTIHRELAHDLFPVKADQGQIEQILLNLYINASEAMPGGGDLFLKTMNLTHEDMSGKPYTVKPGNYVLASVNDTGVGMDKKTLEHIFDPFFTTKGLANGTGLGLASVYGIVKAHGGYIDVYSEKGHGSTFKVYLPTIEKGLVKDKGVQKEIAKRTETILFVDD